MKKFLAGLLTMALALSLAACSSKEPASSGIPSGSPSPETSPAQPISDGTPVRGGTLKIGKGLTLSTLDPTKVTARDSDYDVLCQIYEPLIRADASGNLEPGLADSWDVVDDTTIVFYLRRDVKFHDGTAFNAEAVKVNCTQENGHI